MNTNENKTFRGSISIFFSLFYFFLTNYYPCDDNANCRLCGYLLNFFLFCLFIDNSTLIPMNQTNLPRFLFNLFRDNRYSRSNIYSLLRSHYRCTISPSSLCSPPYVRIIPSRLYNAKQNILELEFTKKKNSAEFSLVFRPGQVIFQATRRIDERKKKKKYRFPTFRHSTFSLRHLGTHMFSQSFLSSRETVRNRENRF